MRALVPEDLPTTIAAQRIAERRSMLQTISALVVRTARGQHGRPDDVGRQLFGDDYVPRAAVPPLMTTTSGLPSATAVRLLGAVAPASAALALFDRSTSVDLSEFASVHLPAIVDPAPAVFIREGEPGPVAQFSLAAPIIGPLKKILIMAALTREMESASGGTALTIVTRALDQAASKGIDAVALGNGAATSAQPAGLRFGVTPIASGGGTGVEAAAADIAKAVGAIAAAGLLISDVVVIAPADVATKLALLASPKFTSPILPTTALPAGTVMVISPSGVAASIPGAATVETSIDTVVHFEDSTPLPLASPVAAPMRSAFQQDIVVVRVRAQAAWAALPGAVQVISGVAW
jgi:hypothetical protein